MKASTADLSSDIFPQTMNILHGFTEVAGQMYNSAEAVRRVGHQATASVLKPHPYDYPTDRVLYPNEEPSPWKSRYIRGKTTLSALVKYDIFNYWAGGTLLSGYDLHLASIAGKPIVMTFCGSQIRSVKAAAEKSPYLNANNWPRSPLDEEYLNSLNDYVDVAIVQYHELEPYAQQYFDRVEHVPRLVDCRSIQPMIQASQDTVTIAHAPSDPELKGTSYVKQAVSSINKRGYSVELDIAEGSHKDIIKIFQRADIVIDRLKLGTYGVVSLEAMATGTPVVCYLRDDLQKKYPSSLPIVNSTPEGLEDALLKLISNPKWRIQIGKEGREYVEQYHSLPVVGKQLANVYESIQ